jgi:hypothetical protein
MITQHTPGPWAVAGNFYQISDAQGTPLAHVYGTASVEYARASEARANACLIAAAPNLYAKAFAAHIELDALAAQPSDTLNPAQRDRLFHLAREIGDVLREANPDKQ